MLPGHTSMQGVGTWERVIKTLGSFLQSEMWFEVGNLFVFLGEGKGMWKA